MPNGILNEKIISNDYADWIITYNGQREALIYYAGADNVSFINSTFAVVHTPVSEILPISLQRTGYSLIPKLYAHMDSSNMESSGINKVRRQPFLNLRGSDVIVAIIDSGIDYTHPVFVNADNTTRISALWDQTIESENHPEDFFYGTEYTREQINEALASENPYDIVPSRDTNGHGTFLAGIAAGNEDPENDFIGAAPNSKIVVVKIKQAKQYLRDYFLIPEGVDAYQENDIMFALQYVIKKSVEFRNPYSCCIGLGNSLGNHAGVFPLSRMLSSNAIGAPNSISVAAGNEGNSRHHFRGVIETETGSRTMEIVVGENEPGFYMEIWGRLLTSFSINVISPSGESQTYSPARQNIPREFTFLFEGTTIFIDALLTEETSGNQIINLRFINPVNGLWRIEVLGAQGENIVFDAWLPVTKFLSTNTFFVESDPYITITQPGDSIAPITTTAYDHTNNSLYLEASRGFTTNDVIKPEIAAPGVNIYGPSIAGGFTRRSGTSVATAHVTGAAALLLEWAIVRGNEQFFSGYLVKNYLIRGAQQDPSLNYPNREWGYGTLNLYNSFDALRNILL